MADTEGVSTVITKGSGKHLGFARTLGAGLLVSLMIVLTAGSAPSPPSPTNARSLARNGIVVTPLTAIEPVSEPRALQMGETWFPELSSVPVGSELVMFSQPSSSLLATPQPAWLFTWNQVTPQALPPTATQPQGSVLPDYWTQMNVVVSATTGQVLLAFTSR